MEKGDVYKTRLYKDNARLLESQAQQLAFLAALKALCDPLPNGNMPKVVWTRDNINDGIIWDSTPQGTEYWSGWYSYFNRLRARNEAIDLNDEFEGEEDDEEE